MNDQQKDRAHLVPAETQIERMENELLAMMRAALDATFRIEVFPEDPGSFDDASTAKLALLQYRGSQYADDSGLAAGSQTRATSFVLHLVYQVAGSSADAPHRPVKDIERLRMELQGRDVMGGEILLLRDGLVEQAPTRRRWILEFSIEVPVVAIPRRPLTPLMTTFPKES